VPRFDKDFGKRLWRKRAVAGLLLFQVLAGCQAKITGNLQLDGANFAITQCRSGGAYGYYGIELTDTNRRRLRLFGNPDGTCTASLFQGDNPTGETIGPCGVLTMTTQASRINNVRNVEGTAKLSCETSAHKLAGAIEFENCH
jgi:hypothetical protein